MKLDKERLDFLHLIETTKLNYKSLNENSKFWLKNESKFPLLFRLALILYNIPASSAFIERFYSLCGNVCKNRSGNMSAETIIARTLLKANIGILDELT